MKNYKVILSLAGLMALASCSSDFLSREPAGSSLTQAQYEKLDNTLEGSMRGIYSMMYAYGGHDEFGKRSIDMYTDLLSGDMALQSYTYGWFYTDESLQSNTDRTGYLWSYYYGMIHNVNVVLNLVSAQSDLVKRVAENGLPTVYNSKAGEFYVIDGSDTLATYTEEDALVAGYYAQALTMRGYCYSNLINLYCPVTKQVISSGYTMETYPTFPVYNENNMDHTQGYGHLADTYAQVENDLETAIDYFTAFEGPFTRGSKLEADVNVARGLLAYSYLNKADLSKGQTSDAYKVPFENALKYAKDVIESGEYTIIPNANIYSTGFNDVSEASWMWGEDVTTETATGLGSFFGQVDIHSYSYAWAGDTKGIDAGLYDSIPKWDARKGWFRDGSDANFKYCPDKKFFSAKSPTSTKSDDIDREWLSDNVFMRFESMYLIAAEAEYRLGNYSEAITYLTAITDERINPSEATAAADYATYKAGLNSNNLLKAIEFNWRVEMWGEGYALQTFRRVATDTRKRGGNHQAKGGAEIDPTSGDYLFIIPSAEYSYNPELVKN